MKKFFWLITVLVLTGTWVWAADFEASGTITAVEVYPMNATVTRSAEVPLKTGTREVIFTGLPRRLDPGSLRVRAEGPDNLKIAGVDLKQRYHKEAGNEQVRDLENRLKSLNARSAEIKGELDLAAQKREFYAAIQATALQNAQNEISGKPATVDDYQRAAEYAFKGIADSMAAQRDAAERLQTVTEDMELIQRELNQLRVGQSRQSLDVVVTLQASAAGHGTVELDYQVPDAQWSALYIARFNPDTRLTELEYKAQVIQNTGEDWDDVQLKLSTARPDQGTGAPERSPWILEESFPMETKRKAGRNWGAVPAPMELESDTVSSTGLDAREPAPAAPMTSSVEQTGIRIRFVIPARTSIPGNGDQKQVTISVSNLQSEMEYRCTPKFSEKVYLTNRYTNTSETPFLQGAARIFYGNQFVGEHHIAQIASGEEFSIPYGSVDSINVERKIVSKDRETALFSSNIRWKHRYATTVENLFPYPVTVLVQDQVPVSRDDRVDVLEIQTNPSTDPPDDQGMVEWKIPLKAKEKAVVELAFDVVHPEDMRVRGL